MRILLSITGVTDGYGLGKLHEILTKRFVTARRGAGILRTHGMMPDVHELDLADGSLLTSVSGSCLLVVRPDPNADARHFAVIVATDSRAFADQLCRDFVAPGVDVNLKSIEVREPGKAPADATVHA